MKRRINCPHCQLEHVIDVDTMGVRDGDRLRDLIECKCGEASIVETLITAATEVFAVVPTSRDPIFRKRREIKELLDKLADKVWK